MVRGTCLAGGGINHIAEENRFMARPTRKSPTRKHGPTVRAKPASRHRPSRRVVVLVATRKGAWLFHGDTKRNTWRVDGPHFLGPIVNPLVLDPRAGRPVGEARSPVEDGPGGELARDQAVRRRQVPRPPAFAK